MAKPTVCGWHDLYTPPHSDMAESPQPDRVAITIEITPEQKRHIE